jgi:hypothetical protein
MVSSVKEVTIITKTKELVGGKHYLGIGANLYVEKGVTGNLYLSIFSKTDSRGAWFMPYSLDNLIEELQAIRGVFNED